MAERARLSAPPSVRTEWPWHQLRATSLRASSIWTEDRRFEADAYLASGYGIRLACKSQANGWAALSTLARAWMPNRLKGIIGSKAFGEPYLSATQMLDLRPSPRRFLSLPDATVAELSVAAGTVLVTRSGTVGRSTITHRLHEKKIVSDDLLRIEPHDPAARGWIYAYLRTPSARQMMTSVHYGHMIKHLEPSHMDALPVPSLGNEMLAWFEAQVSTMLALRNRSYDRLLEAEAMFAAATGMLAPSSNAESPSFEIRSSVNFRGRMRLEASFYSPKARKIVEHFTNVNLRVEPLRCLTERVWWGARFRRIFGNGGLPYYSADALWTLNPSPEKYILIDYEEAAEADPYMVKPGWLIMACSGQVYGLNGSVDIVTDKLAKSFLSHDLIRIIPRKEIRPGYLLVALGHPLLGRPLVVRNAYGSSIPHLDPDDVADIPVVRLTPVLEAQIADAGEEWVRLREEANTLETTITEAAEKVIEQFLASGAGTGS